MQIVYWEKISQNSPRHKETKVSSLTAAFVALRLVTLIYDIVNRKSQFVVNGPELMPPSGKHDLGHRHDGHIHLNDRKNIHCSIFRSHGRVSIMGEIKCNKGVRRMPWRIQAMKDVVRCDKLRGAASRL